MQAILEAHNTQSHRTVLEVRVACLWYSIEIDIDYIIEHAHGSANSTLELAGIEFAIIKVCRKIDRSQIAHSNFVIIGIQSNLGAKIRAMHYAVVILRRTDITWVLESDPRMSCFKQHAEHFAP